MTVLDEVIEFLTTSHLKFDGGYPYDYTWIDDTLVIAGLSGDNETSISTYKKNDLIAWHDRAKQFMQEEADFAEDFVGAMYETESDG